MGLWQGFKSLFVGTDIIEEEEYETYRPQVKPEVPEYKEPEAEEELVAVQEEEEEPVEEKPAKRVVPDPSLRRSYRKNYSERESEDTMAVSTVKQSSFDLVLARPNNFKEVEKIGTDVNQKKTVILNLELVKQEDATRILDFLWGVAFANDDEIKMMANKTYAIIPRNVNFQGVDLVSELENNGYSF